MFVNQNSVEIREFAFNSEDCLQPKKLGIFEKDRFTTATVRSL